MKAERRHQLRTNTLAQFLTDLPLYLKFHANKFLVGVIVLCLIVLLVRYRRIAAQQAQEMTRTSLDSARVGLDQLKNADRVQTTPMARIQERRKLAQDVGSAIDQVLDNTAESDDPALRARALMLRGDMYWTLANLPPLPGSATQPSLMMPQSPAEYLNAAEAAYKEIITKYDSDKYSKAGALLGLAAIEENRGNWDKAIAYYNSVSSDPQIPRMFADVATQRVGMIPVIRMPVFVGSFSSTQPATTEPSTQPAEAQSMAPSTAPTVQPTTAPTPG